MSGDVQAAAGSPAQTTIQPTGRPEGRPEATQKSDGVASTAASQSTLASAAPANKPAETKETWGAYALRLALVIPKFVISLVKGIVLGAYGLVKTVVSGIYSGLRFVINKVTLGRFCKPEVKKNNETPPTQPTQPTQPTPPTEPQQVKAAAKGDFEKLYQSTNDKTEAEQEAAVSVFYTEFPGAVEVVAKQVQAQKQVLAGDVADQDVLPLALAALANTSSSS